MSETPNSAQETLELFGASYLRLHQLTTDTGDSQWRPGYSPKPTDGDEGRRITGQHSDIVYNTVIDRSRTTLRAAMIESEKALEAAQRTMELAVAKLTAAKAEAARPDLAPRNSEPS